MHEEELWQQTQWLGSLASTCCVQRLYASPRPCREGGVGETDRSPRETCTVGSRPTLERDPTHSTFRRAVLVFGPLSFVRRDADAHSERVVWSSRQAVNSQHVTLTSTRRHVDTIPSLVATSLPLRSGPWGVK